MIDSFNRDIKYARVSLTDKCNYRCFYCMPECGIEKKAHSEILSLDDMYKILSALKKCGFEKVRFTGGEPLVRKGAVDLISKVQKELKIDQLSITTNGVYIKENINVLKNLDSINISIDSFDAEKYKMVTRGGNLQDALDGFYAIKDSGIKRIKVNAVLMKGINDNEIKDFAVFGKENNVDVRFIELMPFSFGNSYETYGISANEVIAKYNLKKVEKKTYTNNAETYMFDSGEEVSFIRPLSNKFCSKCNRIRITSDGKMLLCLHRLDNVDLKPYINDEEKLIEAIKEGIKNKPECHELNNGKLQTRSMNKIGG